MFKKLFFNLFLFILSLLSIFIVSCNVGSKKQIYSFINIPTTTYKQSDIQKKFALYSSAGGGMQTLTEIDTGSYFYVIESSHVGSNIRKTGESITLYYDHGDTIRSGEIAYTVVSYLDESGNTIISTNNQVPIVIVPDGVINTNNDPSKNYAIMGMRLNSNLSARLYLPYPFNQTYIFNAPESKIQFGVFSSKQVSQFGMYKLVPTTCANGSYINLSSVKCWNDGALQVSYTAKYKSQNIESVISTLFDSGASSNFQFIPIPDWLESRDGIVTNTTLKSAISTSLGNYPIQLNTPIAVEESNFNGGNMVNAGNELFNHYAVFYNQQTGIIGLKNIKQ